MAAFIPSVRLIENTPYFLVHWLGFAPSEATWEPLTHFPPNFDFEHTLSKDALAATADWPLQVRQQMHLVGERQASAAATEKKAAWQEAADIDVVQQIRDALNVPAVRRAAATALIDQQPAAVRKRVVYAGTFWLCPRRLADYPQDTAAFRNSSAGSNPKPREAARSKRHHHRFMLRF